MKKAEKVVQLLIIAGFITLQTMAGDSVKVWKMKNEGYFIFQAEHAQNVLNGESDWVLTREAEGYTGDGYLKWNGTAEAHINKKDYEAEKESEKITFYVDIETKGWYHIKMWNYHKRKDGDNDIWVSANNKEWIKIFDHDSLKFTWDEGTHWPEHYFESGLNKIEFSARSRGFGLDRIVLFQRALKPESWEEIKGTIWIEDTIESDFYYVTDTIPPEKPQIETEKTFFGDSDVRLFWQDVTDDNWFIGYDAYLNDEKVNKNTIGYGSYKFVDLDSCTEYALKIAAVDWLGNISLSDVYNVRISDCSSAVQKPELAETIHVYPNPATDALRIDSGEKCLRIEIFSSSGILLYAENKNDKQNQINTRNMPKGMVIVRIFTKHQIFNKKLIINK